MTVYVDIIISVNFIINYLILKSVKIITGAKEKPFGILLSSILGGLYAVFMFDDRVRIIYSFPFKIIFSAAVVAISFKCADNYIKYIICFYISSFAFSGVISLTENITGVVIMKNGMVYIDNNVWIILSSVVISFCFITYVLRFIHLKKKSFSQKAGITVCIDGKSVEINGLVDTGNMLFDPISLYPVVVAEYDRIKPILPEEIKEFLKEGSNLNCVLNKKYSNKIRLIPYDTISSHEILKGFKPDYIKINGQEEEIEDVIVAVIYKKLSFNNDYNAILNPLI